MQAITLAATKAVAAGKSCLTIDISECADEGLKAVGELLKNSKGCSLLAESDDDRDMYVRITVRPYGYTTIGRHLILNVKPRLSLVMRAYVEPIVMHVLILMTHIHEDKVL